MEEERLKYFIDRDCYELKNMYELQLVNGGAGFGNGT